MIRPSLAVTSALLVGCGTAPERTPAIPQPSPATPRAIAVDLSVEPRGRTRTLHGPFTGSGRQTFRSLAVPRRYELRYVCAGEAFGLRVSGESVLRESCADDPTSVLRSRPADRRTVTVTVTAGEGTRWALLLTTAGDTP